MRNTAFLDAVRAFAALWVAAAHCCIWGGFDVFGLPSAKEAVDLFMVLSGFLMVYTWDRKREDPGAWRTWLAFYVRRFFRIAPAYYLCLAVVALVWGQYAGGFATFRAFNPGRWASGDSYDPATMAMDARNIALHVTFLFGLFPRWSFSTMLPDWSLSLEMQFYAFFPLLFILLRYRPLWLVGALGLACMAFTVGYDVAWPYLGLAPFREPSLLPFRLPVFLVGMLLHDAKRDGVVRPAPLVLAVLLLAGERWAAAEPPSLLFGALMLLMVVAWLQAPPVVERLARARVVKFAADCSYSVYLFHGLVLSLVGTRVLTGLLARGWDRGPAVAMMSAVVLIGVYPLSWLIYRGVERPFMRLGERVALRVGSPAIAVDAGRLEPKPR